MFKNEFIKTIGAALLICSLLSAVLYTPPLQAKAEPILLSFLIGGIASVFGVDFFSCSFNLLFYCDSGGAVVGSDGGGSVVQDPCTSSANACGQTNTGFYSADHSTCSADAPSNASCPAPNIATNDFYAQPNIIKSGDTTTLHWTSTNATACTITSDSGFNSTAGPSGTVTTGALTQSSTFNLTCQNGTGGPQGSASIKVTVTPKFQEK